MPIKGFTERARLSRGGHLRLGRKEESGKTGKEYPVKSDYFIADFEDPEHARIFHEIYGAEPRDIEICFHTNDPDEIFPQWYCCYGASSGLKCKGDGETATRLTGPGKLDEVECLTPEHCDFAKANGCKQLGMLQFLIRGLPTMKVFQINTTSWNSMSNVNSAIRMLLWLRRGQGIAGVWIRLKLVKRETTSKDKGGKVTIYVIEIDLPPNVSIEGGANLLSIVDGREAPAASSLVSAPVIGAIQPDTSRDDLLHGAPDDRIPIASETAEPDQVFDTQKKSEEQERADLISQVAQLLNALPANEVRVELVRRVQKASGLKSSRWSEWDTESIWALRRAITQGAQA